MVLVDFRKKLYQPMGLTNTNCDVIEVFIFEIKNKSLY